ncbi:hypothetical protein V2J09_021249 [Rumex salicifolius]
MQRMLGLEDRLEARIQEAQQASQASIRGLEARIVASESRMENVSKLCEAFQPSLLGGSSSHSVLKDQPLSNATDGIPTAPIPMLVPSSGQPGLSSTSTPPFVTLPNSIPLASTNHAGLDKGNNEEEVQGFFRRSGPQVRGVAPLLQPVRVINGRRPGPAIRHEGEQDRGAYGYMRPTEMGHYGGRGQGLFSPVNPMMNALLWNVRGAGKASFLRSILYLKRAYKTNVMALFETQLSGLRAREVCAKLNLGDSFVVDSIGRAGGIFLSWDPMSLGLKIVKSGPRFVLAEFTSDGSSEDRIGGSGSLHHDSGAFRACLDNSGLIDMGCVGSRFTWSRGLNSASYVAKRLDRVTMNMDAFLAWPSATVRHLPSLCSDHMALLFCLKPGQLRGRGRRPFRFEEAWTHHSGFLDFVRDSWYTDRHACEALEALRGRLKWWNVHVFGDVNKRKASLISRIAAVQSSIALDPSDSDICLLNSLSLELDSTLAQEEAIWRQKSKESWLLDGERNT